MRVEQEVIVMELSKEQFIKDYHLENNFDKAGVAWDELSAIARDFESRRHELEVLAEEYARKVRTFDKVHSVRVRVKDTEHLLEKIVRKSLERDEREGKITVENYTTEITDLVGIRALYVIKSDFIPLHYCIVKEYKTKFAEKPQVKLRVGDRKSLYNEIKKGVEFQEDEVYRSIHYNIRETMEDSKPVHVELQTRSIFEEGWSELNHEMVYKQNKPQTTTLLLQITANILSSLAGNCDSLGELMNTICKQDIPSEDLVRETAKYQSDSDFVSMLVHSINSASPK